MKAAMESDDGNDELICPITLQVFRNPVTAADGHVYERDAIVQWIAERGTSPFTREPLRIEDLQPNDRLRNLAARRRNSTVVYDAHNATVTLPPIRLRGRHRARVAPTLDHLAEQNQPPTQCWKLCLKLSIVALCVLGPCIVIIGLTFGLASRPISSSYNGDSKPTGGYWTYVPGGYGCPIRVSQGINTTYSSALSYNSTRFFRTSDNTSVFYYKAILLTVNITGTYNLFSASTIDMYGYLYADYFNSTDTAVNLLTEDDDCGGSLQFLMTFFLMPNTTYILVVTTYAANVTGLFSVMAYGPAGASLG